MKTIPVEKLRELGKYLDECPNDLSDKHHDEYWRLLIKSLPKRLYTRDQIERFADEYQSTSGSPSLLLLYDLREKGVKLEQFKHCLEKIRCDKALNLFLHGSEFQRRIVKSREKDSQERMKRKWRCMGDLRTIVEEYNY